MSASSPRILHISSVYPPHVIGGAERVVEQLAEAQAAFGLAVGAAYLSQAAQAPGERRGVATFPRTSRNLIWMEDVPQSPRPMRTANKLWQVVNARAAADFGAAMAAFRPDIVHTHSMVDLPPHIWTVARAAGARVVHSLHDYDLICSRASLFRNGANCVGRHAACRIIGGWKARFTGAIDAVAAVSAPVLEEHERLGLFRDVPARRRRVIWNAVPGAGLAAAAPRRPRLGPFRFGFLGRLVPEKGIGTLIAACRALPADGWRLTVAGRALDGDDEWRAQAAGLPIDFAGFVDPVPFLDAIDVLVVPSVWREPFGLTVVEAFARGVPVIGADQGAIRDLVSAVNPAWVVPAGDAAALAVAMRAMLAAGRDALPPRAAYAPVLAAVTPERMLGDYLLLYADLMADRQAA